jgi:DNA gyrase subunit A
MRTRVSEIRETGRNAAGVRLIKVGEGDKLVAMAKIDAEPDKPAGDGETPPPAATIEGPAATGDSSIGDADGAAGDPDGTTRDEE